MDAVSEARTSVEHSLHTWAKDGKTLFKVAQQLGVDTTPVIAEFGGAIPTTGRLRTPGRRGRPRGRSNSTGAPTEQQILEAIRTPMSQTDLASRFGTTRQTISRRLEKLVSSGQATVDGSGGHRTWCATTGTAAAA